MFKMSSKALHPESYPPQWDFLTWDCPLDVHSVEKGRSLDIDFIKQLLDEGLEEKILLLLLVKNEVKWLQICNHLTVLIDQ